MNRDSNQDEESPALEHMTDAARHQLYERARVGGADGAQLAPLDLPTLRALAAHEGIDARPGLSRPELQFLVWHHRCAAHGIGLCRGILEVLPEGFGFLRQASNDYLAGASDVYLSPSQIHRLNLRSGHEIAGPVRLPRRGEQYFALLRVETLDGAPLADLQRRIPFAEAVAILPQQRLPLTSRPDAGDTAPTDPAVRAIERLSPWGRGQRILMQAPPGSGRTRLLQQLAAAAMRANPDLQVLVCLLGERPEDVTTCRRALQAGGDRCTVVATTFDEPPARHIGLADLALSRSQRLVESGRHVLLVVDSLTALVRACQHEQPPTGRTVVPGLDVGALQRGKRLFAAGRNLEGGASLTVITAVVTGDSRIDQAIADEFTGKANAEVVLDPRLVAERIDPPLDVLRTRTRREDLLLPPDELAALAHWRQQLADLPPQARIEEVLGN